MDVGLVIFRKAFSAVCTRFFYAGSKYICVQSGET